MVAAELRRTVDQADTRIGPPLRRRQRETIAAAGRYLYLPNARFSTPPTPTTDYWVTRISRPGC